MVGQGLKVIIQARWKMTNPDAAVSQPALVLRARRAQIEALYNQLQKNNNFQELQDFFNLGAIQIGRMPNLCRHSRR